MRSRTLATPLLVALLACALWPSPARAEWAGMPLEEAVQDSDLIVVGTLTGVTSWSTRGWDYGAGTVLVREVLWGDARPGDGLDLRWRNESSVACPRVEPERHAGSEGVWLLTRAGGGTVRADHPGRVRDVAERADVERWIRDERTWVAVRTERSHRPGTPVPVTFVFRNASAAPVTYPGLELADGVLYADPRFRVEAIRDAYVQGATPAESRIVVSADVPPIRVEPGREVRLTTDLGMLAQVRSGAWTIRARVRGHSPSNDGALHISADAVPDLIPSPPAAGGVARAIVGGEPAGAGPPGLYTTSLVVAVLGAAALPPLMLAAVTRGAARRALAPSSLAFGALIAAVAFAAGLAAAVALRALAGS